MNLVIVTPQSELSIGLEQPPAPMRIVFEPLPQPFRVVFEPNQGSTVTGGGGDWGEIGGTLSAQTDLQSALDAKESTITAGTTAQYYRGDKSFQTLDKAAVGLANVDNTTDAGKPISTATQSALDGKASTSHDHDADYAALVHAHVISDVTGLQTAMDAKQATLVSGTNIKTVNGESLLGSGDIEIVGGGNSYFPSGW